MAGMPGGKELRESGRGKYVQAYLSGERLRRWEAILAEGATPAGLADLAMDAWDARRGGDPAAELCLQVGRDLRMRLAEAGLVPFADPDAERERDHAYATGKPLRGTVSPLREGRRPAGVKFRPPEA